MMKIPRVRAQCTVRPLYDDKWLTHVTTPDSEFERHYTIAAADDNAAAKEAMARFEEEYPHDRSGHTVGS